MLIECLNYGTVNALVEKYANDRCSNCNTIQLNNWCFMSYADERDVKIYSRFVNEAHINIYRFMQMQLHSVFYTVGNSDKLVVKSNLCRGLAKGLVYFVIAYNACKKVIVVLTIISTEHDLLRNFHFEFNISSPIWGITECIKQFLK